MPVATPSSSVWLVTVKTVWAVPLTVSVHVSPAADVGGGRGVERDRRVGVTMVCQTRIGVPG